MVFIYHLCYVLQKLQAADAFREGNRKEVDYLIQEVSVTLIFFGEKRMDGDYFLCHFCLT
jgi:hypothetical protein